MKRISLLLLALTLPTGAAMAQDNEGGDRKIVYKTKTEIDFESLDVAGELVKPQGALLLSRKKGSFNPLIKLRTDFNEEMDQSVNYVK
jgi:hypothetical protein